MIPLMNAAGMVKSPADVRKLLALPHEMLYAVTMGSFTPKARDGNSGTTYASPLNALGMPNPGIEALALMLEEVEHEVWDSKKTLRVSVAGFCPDDYAFMARKLEGQRVVRVIELNLGCPNVRNNGKQEGIISFNPDLIAEVIEAVYDVYRNNPGTPEIAVKLSPYSDPALLDEVLHVIGHRPEGSVHHVVMTNTFANAFGFDEAGQPLISANGGYAGLAGPALKHIALGQIRKAHSVLPKSISCIGVGGISTGRDVRDMELAGASAVQIGTAFFEHMNPRVFMDITVEHEEAYG